VDAVVVDAVVVDAVVADAVVVDAVLKDVVMVEAVEDDVDVGVVNMLVIVVLCVVVVVVMTAALSTSWSIAMSLRKPDPTTPLNDSLTTEPTYAARSISADNQSAEFGLFPSSSLAHTMISWTMTCKFPMELSSVHMW